MTIPDLNTEGLLPEGVFDCSLAEIEQRFGQFQRTDARCRLFERLNEFVQEARRTNLVVAVIVDGSFATDKECPNDIDLVLVLRGNHNFSAVLRPFEYHVMSRRQVRRLYGFDVLVAQEGQAEVDDASAFSARFANATTCEKEC